MDTGAPQWLRESSYGMRYARRDPNAVEYLDASTQVGTVPFYQVSDHGPNRDTVEEFTERVRRVHDLGGKALAYVCFMDVRLDPTITGVPRNNLLYTPQLANTLLVDDDLRFVNTRMDWSWRQHRFLLCYNTQVFVDAALRHVRAILDMGADGFFVDNAHSQHECGGARETDRLQRASPHRGRTLPGAGRLGPADPSLEEVPLHTHLDPEIDQTEAFHRFMLRFYELVKQYDPDNIVLLNNNTTLPDASDGSMWESIHLLVGVGGQAAVLGPGEGRGRRVSTGSWSRATSWWRSPTSGARRRPWRMTPTSAMPPRGCWATPGAMAAAADAAGRRRFGRPTSARRRGRSAPPPRTWPTGSPSAAWWP